MLEMIREVKVVFFLINLPRISFCFMIDFKIDF